MKKKTRKQELVVRPHLLPLGFYLYEKRVKICLNRKGTKFPILNNGLLLWKYYNQGLEQN